MRSGTVVTFPPAVAGDTCVACERPMAAHRMNGRWVGCTRDIVIGRDTETLARRLRLSRLQRRVLKVQPFGIGAE